MGNKEGSFSGNRTRAGDPSRIMAFCLVLLDHECIASARADMTNDLSRSFYPRPGERVKSPTCADRLASSQPVSRVASSHPVGTRNPHDPKGRRAYVGLSQNLKDLKDVRRFLRFPQAPLPWTELRGGPPGRPRRTNTRPTGAIPSCRTVLLLRLSTSRRRTVGVGMRLRKRKLRGGQRIRWSAGLGFRV